MAFIFFTRLRFAIVAAVALPLAVAPPAIAQQSVPDDGTVAARKAAAAAKKAARAMGKSAQLAEKSETATKPAAKLKSQLTSKSKPQLQSKSKPRPKPIPHG